MVIGAPFNDSADGSISDSGAVYMFHGRASMKNKMVTDADNLTYGEKVGDHFGWSVNFAGNIDSHNKSEIIVGAPDFDNGSELDIGKVYIITGGPTIPEFQMMAVPVLFILVLIAIVRKRYHVFIKRKRRRGVKA